MIADLNSSSMGVAGEQRLLARVKEALRVMVEWQAPTISQERQGSSLRFALRSFCRHLERVMAFEESDDYFDKIAQERPDCQSRVGRLRVEHSRIRQQIAELEPKLDEPAAWQAESLKLSRVAVKQLLDEVDRHDRHEVRLLQETLLREDGGEG
ncbi:hemerythrin domain-containing protein [Botrimarina hoheduenensis]|uniref:Hemerythrin-like domain-containing protein n=1 Tax=Botrimarina hoheduenensis TaxID=2528000 RepID=A0A5C5WFD4_9BACT|nr:hemerythrin domain-containing protein [Botrimarina hoheduenensis]TWT48793.1 hypothetical protein Pla111_05680 [Botrimarina hoheduenensis]